MRLEWDAAVRRDCARMNPSGRAGRGATVPDRQGQVPGPPRPLDRDDASVLKIATPFYKNESLAQHGRRKHCRQVLWKVLDLFTSFKVCCFLPAGGNAQIHE